MPGPRRVALIIDHLGGGGAERAILAVAGGLAHLGYECTVVSFGNETDNAYMIPPNIDVIYLGARRKTESMVDAVRHNLALVRSIRHELWRLRVSCAIAFEAKAAILTCLAAGNLEIFVVASERIYPPMSRLKHEWQMLRRLVYPRLDHIVMQTHLGQKWAAEKFPKVKSSVIPNFVATSGTRSSASREKVVLGVGRLTPQKGFDLLIPAFAAATSHAPDWSLAIAGEGSERSRLEALAAQYCPGRVTFLGFRREVEAYYSMASIFVLSSRFEGFPNALIEAMASGAACVAFDCPSGPGEIIYSNLNGILVPNGDVSELAAAIRGLVGNSDLRIRLGNDAQAYVAKHLTVNSVIQEWAALIEGL